MNRIEKGVMTRQNVTRMVKALENELDAKLLISTKRGIALTEAGIMACKASQELQCRVERLRRELKTNSKIHEIKGNLSISVSPMLNVTVLPQAYAEFSWKYPAVQLFIRELYRDAILEDNIENKETLGIVVVSSLVEDFVLCSKDMESLTFTKSKQYPVYVMMAPAHPLAGMNSVCLQTLKEYPQVIFEAGGKQGVGAFSNEVILSSSNCFLCEEKLSDEKSQAIMYSFPLYKKRGFF